MVSMEFFIDIILLPHYGPGVDSVTNRNEYQEYFLGGKGSRCMELTTLLPSCAKCLEIWDPQPPGILRVCLSRNGIVLPLLALRQPSVNNNYIKSIHAGTA